MKSLSLFAIFIFGFSCSSSRTRNRVYTSELAFKGGVYKAQEWSNSLNFKRISWFRDSSIVYEILVAKLDKESPFISWLEKDKAEIDRCDEFYVGIYYADLNAPHGSFMIPSQLKAAGLEERSILDFSDQVKAHENYKDWNLEKHRVRGFCKRKGTNTETIVTIPGYKSIKFP